MSRPVLLTIAATVALTACQNTSPEAEAAANSAAAQANLATPVELPPAEEARVNFRCQPGNTIQTVVFFAGDRQVGLPQDGSPTLTILKRTEEQGPYTLPTDLADAPAMAGGDATADAGATANATAPAAVRQLSLTGDQKQVVILETGKPTLTCKV